MSFNLPGANSPKPESRDEKFKHSIFTVPNVICLVRLLGTGVLLALAIVGWPVWFLGLFLFLSLTDLIDGTLARWLHQRSDFGARLDSIADLSLHAVLLVGASMLVWDSLKHEWAWVLVAIGSYGLATGAGWWKFGRVPSYHTLGAKLSYGLSLLAGVSLLLEWSVWPLRIAACAVTLTNLESLAITWTLEQWQTDVLTWFHTQRDSRQGMSQGKTDRAGVDQGQD